MNKITYCRECGKKDIKVDFRMWLGWILCKRSKPMCFKCMINWDEMNSKREDYKE